MIGQTTGLIWEIACPICGIAFCDYEKRVHRVNLQKLLILTEKATGLSL